VLQILMTTEIAKNALLFPSAPFTHANKF